jgi:hypothetical protein
MKLSFSNFLDSSWADDLKQADNDWAYYSSFNEQLYGQPFDYEDVVQNLPEFAEMAGNMITESRKKKLLDELPEPSEYEDEDDDDGVDADVPSGEYGTSDKAKDKKNQLLHFTRKQWDDHQERIKGLFRPRRDKKGRLKNPHAGVSLISPGDNNPKTEKGYAGSVPNPHTGESRPMKNAVMHLLPAGFSGCNTCAAHTPECAASCLDVAGNPGFMGVKTSGRARRTFMFAYNKNAALIKMAKEIDRMVYDANSAGLNFGLRLNGTSDIAWESDRYKFVFQRSTKLGQSKKKKAIKEGVERGSGYNCPTEPDAPKSIFCHFPEVQFYDYTKIFSRAMDAAQGKMPKNYHLTFSYSEKTNLKEMERLLDAGGNVAMVFAFAEKNYDPEKAEKTHKAREAGRQEKQGDKYKAREFTPDAKGRELVKNVGPYKLPKIWRGENGKAYKIISGDVHDLRFTDEPGVIVGLAAKGDAKFVQSNGTKQVFVVQPDDPHLRYEEENMDWVVSATNAAPRREKYVADRKRQDAEFVADLRKQAAELEDGDPEKEELLARAERIESGKVNYYGKNAQRDRSNAMYDLAHEPDAPSEDNPEGLSPIEHLRQTFKDRAAQDLEKRIAREIRKMELSGTVMSEPEKEQYRERKRKEYASDYDGLPQFKQKDGLPHYQATDPGKAPNEQPSGRISLPLLQGMPEPREPSELDRYIASRRDDFESRYRARLPQPTSGASATPAATAPARKRQKVESANPYLSGLLNLCG